MYFDRFGKPSAFVAWILLNDSDRNSLLRDGTFPMSVQAASNGSHLCLLDFEAAPGSGRAVLEDLRDQLFAGIDACLYYRIKHGRRIFKLVSRASTASFFNQARTAQTA